MSTSELPHTLQRNQVEMFFRTVWARAYPRIIGQQREKAWMFFEVFLPFLGTVAYVFVYRAIQAPEEFIGFVIMGGAMTSFWLNVLWSMSSQLYWEKETGNLALYIMAPNSMIAILLGMAVGGIVATTIRALVVLILGSLAFQVTYSITNFVQLFLVFLLTMTALYGMGTLFASVFLLWGREAWHISNMLQEPVYLASGFFFPVSFFPFWISLAVSLLPLTLGLDSMRQLMFSGSETFGLFPVEIEIGLLVVLSIVFIAGAKFALDHIERVAIREGRLTDRRQ